MLAVKVDFETKQATIGTRAGGAVSISEILAALKSIGYQGKLVEDRMREEDVGEPAGDGQ